MKKNEKYVIGVDGGGTKTEAALANLKGKILKLVRTGPSNLRNVGIENAVLNICEAIRKAKKGKEISSIFIGLAAVEEEFKFEKGKIKRKILKKLKFTYPPLACARGAGRREGKLEIVSDQIAAFRSGTDEKNGIVLISGTGCVCHGWKGKKEAKTSGWGWLDDEGSGFWVGQRGFQAVFKELDGRELKTKITKLIFRKLEVKNKEDLLKKIYFKNSVLQTSLVSRIIDEATKRGDKIAISIMKEAGKELAKSAITVMKKLNFRNKEFPLVLIGGMFNSKGVLETVKKEIKRVAPKVKFIQPKQKPVMGAIKLAIENLD